MIHINILSTNSHGCKENVKQYSELQKRNYEYLKYSHYKPSLELHKPHI